MSKILVSGGNGFIGSKLMERLSKDNQVESFDLVNGQDLRDLEQVCKAVKGKDVVFHLAAIADLNWARVHPIETMEINIKGTWNIAYACYKYKARLFFASTMCVYGNQKEHPSTELSLPNPSEIYACSKLAGESVIKGFHYTYGLQYNMMRFATIYGEGTRPALGTHIFLRQALTGYPITIHGDGNQTRTLTYIIDLIDAIEALYKSGKINQIWNLTSEEEVSANQMAESIKKITGSSSEISHISQRVGQTYKEQVSARKMFNEIGWNAKISWDEGIRKMYDWFIKTNQVNNVYVDPK